MNCREVRRLLFLYVDRQIEQTVLVSFQRHLHTCPHCAGQIEHTQRVLTVVRERCCRQAAPSSLRERIRRCLDEGAEAAGATGDRWEPPR